MHARGGKVPSTTVSGKKKFARVGDVYRAFPVLDDDSGHPTVQPENLDGLGAVDVDRLTVLLSNSDHPTGPVGVTASAARRRSISST